jgi:hypothetical protein
MLETTANSKLKNYKSPGSDQFWQNWFKQEIRYYCLISINLLTLFGVLLKQWKDSIIIPIYKMGDD